MRESLLEFFGPQERRLTVAGDEVIVKTLPNGADVEALRDGLDVEWKLLARCTFFAADGKDHKAGEPAFTDADIEILKAAPRVRTLPLIRAVEAVNAFDLYTEVKNSEAGPSVGSSSPSP